MTRGSSQNGMTIIELLVACLISLIFILAAGTGYLVNQKAFAANREKLELQQTASHVMEIMEKRIREAGDVDIPNPNNRITVRDVAGVQTTLFRLNTNGPEAKLFEQNSLLAKQELIEILFIPNRDTTVVQIQLNLEDKNKNRVAIRGSATLRNHPKLRFLEPKT